jgi:hypothetical protein
MGESRGFYRLGRAIAYTKKDFHDLSLRANWRLYFIAGECGNLKGYLQILFGIASSEKAESLFQICNDNQIILIFIILF